MNGLDHLIGNGARAVDAASSPAYFAGFWFLALVFVWSGVAKLHHRRLAGMAVAEFMHFRRVHPLYGVTLGVSEVGLGIALVVGPVREFASVVAALVLAAFCIVLARSLARGDRFPCYCFGSDSALSIASLARTAGLGLLAAGLAVATLSANPAREVSSLASATGGAAALCLIVLTSISVRLIVSSRELIRELESSAAERAGVPA